MPFQIVRFSAGADAGSVGYSTLGLSGYSLASPASGRPIRQELFMLAPESLKSDLVVSLLLQAGSAALRARRPLLRGNVMGPAGALIPGSDLTALYVTTPVYFPDEFAAFQDPNGDVLIAWLVPISDAEADYVAAHGWDAFEDELVNQDPDLVNLFRKSMRF